MGTNTNLSFIGPSGAQKSVLIAGLLPDTNYVFSINASDLSGNTFVDNPILVNVKTVASTACSGTDTQSQQGSFSSGYNYDFETIGTDVKITFELLETNPQGVVAFLWKENPFGETQMTNVSGNIFTKIITGQTIDSTISYAVKFAFAGGLAVTKYFPYVVGSTCNLGIERSSKLNAFTFQNPAKDYLEIHSEIAIDKIEIYNMTGVLLKVATAVKSSIDINDLPTGIYLLTVYLGSQKSIKKLLVE